MPFVTGFLRVRRRPGRPDQGLPPGEDLVDPGYGVEGPEDGEDVDPGYGVDVGGRPRPPIVLPKPPPGIWPPPSPSHPIAPVPPTEEVPPGTIWPPIGTPEHPIYSQKYWVVAGIVGVGWRYICVDPSLAPSPPAGGVGGRPPPRPTPG